MAFFDGKVGDEVFERVDEGALHKIRKHGLPMAEKFMFMPEDQPLESRGVGRAVFIVPHVFEQKEEIFFQFFSPRMERGVEFDIFVRGFPCNFGKSEAGSFFDAFFDESIILVACVEVDPSVGKIVLNRPQVRACCEFFGSDFAAFF